MRHGRHRHRHPPLICQGGAMPRFFTDQIDGHQGIITGEDAMHIAKSLRMHPGEELTLCDKHSGDYPGIIESVTPQQVIVSLGEKHPCTAEPSVHTALFQALPKGDKMEWIVQKAVELGVSEIHPVLTHRCISRPDAKSFAKKQERYQKIAYEAAKQCGRGIIPVFGPILTLEQALEQMLQYEKPMVFYEHSRQPLRDVLRGQWRSAAILVGSEGGFEQQEIQQALEKGICDASLGNRILRCETAPLAALSVLMYQSGNL